MKTLTWCFAVAASLVTGTARAETVKLNLYGIHCPMCAGTVTDAIAKVPSAKVTQKPTKDEPTVVVEIDLAKADVGDLAKAISEAGTPHRESMGPPEARLIYPAKNLSKDNSKKIKEALEGVKGVLPGAARAEVDKKEIHLKLDKVGGAKLADINKALAEYTK